MKPARRAVALTVGAVLSVIVSASSASAQSHILPTVTPVRTDGGWIYWLAWLSMGLAGIVFLLLVALYMRRAPRFAKDEDDARVVRADRVIPGREPPRRLVDITQAVPVVAQPPAVLAAAPAAAPAAPAAPATPAAAPAREAAPAAAQAPAAAASAEAAPAPAAPAPAAAAAPAPAERPEVSLDQDVYEKTLEELLASGTDRRIAEGKAKRTAMIAARKAAGG
jgi:pyruvate/2-oxoglutarate dehydrogenase complex dihydrolipoamide acyltransferase (E2) component